MGDIIILIGELNCLKGVYYKRAMLISPRPLCRNVIWCFFHFFSQNVKSHPTNATHGDKIRLVNGSIEQV